MSVSLSNQGSPGKLVQLSPAGAGSGLLALDLASIFEKLLDQITTLPPAAMCFTVMFHVKQI